MQSSRQIKHTINKETIRQRGQALALQFKQPEPIDYSLICANDDQHIELRTQVIKAVNTEATDLSRTERDLIYEYVLHSLNGEQNAEHWLEQLSNDIAILAPSTVHSQQSSTENIGVRLLTWLMRSITSLLELITRVLSPLNSRDKTSGYQRGTRIGMLIGACLVVYIAYAFHDAKEKAQTLFQQAHVERWKKTDGTIISVTSKLREHYSQRHAPTIGKYVYKDGRYYVYHYTVNYRYQVAGKTYTFDRLCFPQSMCERLV